MTLFPISGRNKIIAIFCLLGFITNIIAYYPGFMSPDSLDQYTQALTGHYDDWHPPVMALLWSVFNKLYNGPLLMLVFQLSCLWISCYLFMTAIKGFLWYILIAALCCAPFVQNFAGYIVKDVQMAFVWVLAFAIMFKASMVKGHLSAWQGIVCVLLITYGIWIRQNAFTGALFLCYLWSWIILSSAKKIYRIGVFLLLFVSITIAQFPVYYKLVRAEKTYPETKIYLQDITGIYAKTGQAYYPSFLYQNDPFDTARLRTGYTPVTFDHLWTDKNGEEIFPDPDAGKVHQLRIAWLHGIINHPVVYLKNRTVGFLYYLRIKKRNALFNYYYPFIDPNSYGFIYHPNAVSHLLMDGIKKQKEMFYMQPWFWFFLNLLLLAFIPLFKEDLRKRFYVAIVLSSLLYFLPNYFVYLVDTDLRYSYWNCVACTLAFCIFLADVFRLKAGE